MHEWALAESVLAAACNIARERKLKKITVVTVQIGDLQNIESDVLDFAFSQLKSGITKNAKIVIKKERARLKCKACGNEWAFRKNRVDDAVREAIHFVPETAHTFVRCPRCGSPDFEFVRGRGIWLEEVKGAK